MSVESFSRSLFVIPGEGVKDATLVVESLSATLWAFLLTVTKVSRYVPYDLLVK